MTNKIDYQEIINALGNEQSRKEVKELEVNIEKLQNTKEVTDKKHKIAEEIQNRYNHYKEKNYEGVYAKIKEVYRKITEKTRGLDIHSTHFWTSGGSSFGLYQEPEHHSSSEEIVFVKGNMDGLKKYVSLLYLNNLNERNYESVEKRCFSSINNRCHKYINYECDSKSKEDIKKCFMKNTHFYDHIGMIYSTLNPWLENERKTSIFVDALEKIPASDEKMINLERINNFNKLDLQQILQTTKEYDTKINNFLKEVHKINIIIGSYIIDDINLCSTKLNPKAKYFSLDKDCLEDLKIIPIGIKLYVERGEKLKEINETSSKFLENLNNYLHQEVFPLVPKKIFDVYNCQKMTKKS